MRVRKLSIFILFVFFSFTIFSQNLKNSDQLITGTLDNGLQYYIYKNVKPENRASLNLVVSSGSLNETDPQQGLAHFLEHMAFNGTTKYKKNDLVKYLQSLGLSFGGDLNAYTSFGETVYKLQVPTDKKELEEGIEVLREWATEISIDETSLNDEKNIILEEWRLRQGLSQRLGDSQKKAIFGDSRYFDRFPIGLPETIKSATPELLNSYYKKWYHPKNMAVVAVGDFNTKEVEEIIKKYFSYSPSTSFEPGNNYSIENHFKKNTVIFSDPELTNVSINFISRENNFSINSEETFKQLLTKQLLEEIMNTRFSFLSKQANSPINVGYSSSDRIGKFDYFNFITANIKEDKIDQGIEESFKILKSLAENKVSDTELSVEKAEYLSSLSQIVANRSSIQNNTFIEAIKDYYLYQDTFLEPEEELKLVEKTLPMISPEDIQKEAKNLYEKEMVIFFTAPKKDTLNLPDSKDIDTIIAKVKQAPVEKPISAYDNLNLDKMKLESGKIVSTSEKKDFKISKLSNGIEVFYKETPFDKDKIYMQLFKEEGSSNENMENYLNSLISSYLVSVSGVGKLSSDQLEIFMKGKNFSVSPYIDDYEQGFKIITDKANLETSLEFFRLMIANPKIDDNIFINLKEQLKEQIKNRENSPKALYSHKVKEILGNGNERRKPPTLDNLDKMSKNGALNLFKKKFSNFKNYRLIVVGSIDEATFNREISKYFASLPAKEPSDEVKSLNISPISGIKKETVVKGIDKKSTVTLIYPYEGKYSNINRNLYMAFSKVLDIILIEEIREKLGGVYSIYSVSDLEKYNYGENNLKIFFSTDTKRTQEVTNAVKNVVQNIIDGKIGEDKIKDVLENYKLNYETALKKNQFWSQYLYKKSFVEDYEVLTPTEYNTLINYNNMVNFLKGAIDPNNYIEVTLVPEKEE